MDRSVAGRSNPFGPPHEHRKKDRNSSRSGSPPDLDPKGRLPDAEGPGNHRDRRDKSASLPATNGLKATKADHLVNSALVFQHRRSYVAAIGDLPDRSSMQNVRRSYQRLLLKGLSHRVFPSRDVRQRSRNDRNNCWRDTRNCGPKGKSGEDGGLPFRVMIPEIRQHVQGKTRNGRDRA